MSAGTDPDGGGDYDLTPLCQAAGGSCSASSECCSNICDPTTKACATMRCGQAGAACTSSLDCCGLACTNQQCGGKCTSDGQACTSSGDCCSTICGSNGTCATLNTVCKTAGNSCGSGSECCSSVCTNSQCAAPSTVSYCVQVGDICRFDEDCCTGTCQLASGQTVGTCAQLTTTLNCAFDGLLCNGCGTCCSHFCGPFVPGGPAVCQPASGCHVEGDLCHNDSDCCGGDVTSLLPGAGLVKCVKNSTADPIGVCGNASTGNCPDKKMYPTCASSCQPEGDVCHQTNTAVCEGGTTNVRNNCCACISGKECCVPDALGIPRCNALTTCVPANGACAYSSDCCDGLPCVPNADGHLVCGAMCSQAGGPCTTNNDCCTGLVCTVPPGSLGGSCGSLTSPGSADMASTSTCAQVGQACSDTITCCNGISCLDPNGQTCSTGATSCACYAPIL